MPTFPRTVLPRRATWPKVTGPLASWSPSGRGQVRGLAQLGRSWQETYGVLSHDDPTVRAWLATVESYYRAGTVFEVDHRKLRALLGAGGGTGLVNGAGQTGAWLTTDGWTPNTTVLRAGDVVRIAGLPVVRHVLADVASDGTGAATLGVDPPCYTAPADNAEILYNSVVGRVTFRAILAPGSYTPPEADADGLFAGLTLTFAEWIAPASAGAGLLYTPGASLAAATFSRTSTATYTAGP